jgi:hypothetical protein
MQSQHYRLGFRRRRQVADERDLEEYKRHDGEHDDCADLLARRSSHAACAGPTARFPTLFAIIRPCVAPRCAWLHGAVGCVRVHRQCDEELMVAQHPAKLGQVGGVPRCSAGGPMVAVEVDLSPSSPGWRPGAITCLACRDGVLGAWADTPWIAPRILVMLRYADDEPPRIQLTRRETTEVLEPAGIQQASRKTRKILVPFANPPNGPRETGVHELGL